MEIKDLEEKLKSEADNIKLKDFSHRWQNICGKIELEEKKQEVPNEIMVCVTNSSEKNNNPANNKSKLFYSKIIVTLILGIAIILAIVLPLTLNRKRPQFYLDASELVGKAVQESEFFYKINSAGISILNLDFEIDDYVIYTSQRNEVKGGMLLFFDETLMCEGKIHFYDNTVKQKELDKSDFLQYKINNYIFDYKTELISDCYNLKAFSYINRVQYRLEIEFYEEDNSLAFLEKLAI